MRSLLLAGCLVGAMATTGCAAFSDDTAEPGDGVQVVTAFYPLQYVAQRVAGDLASVANLTSPGAEPHDLELPPKATAQIVQADLVVYETDFQPSVDAAIDQNATGVVLDAADVAELVTADDGERDPHFWQDPLRMADLGDAVAGRLGDVDPEHAEDYLANATALREDLETLDASYVAGLAGCARSSVVVSHDAFGYLAKYGLDLEPIAGLSPGAEPTPADLARLQDLIGRDGITTVFSEALVSASVSESLARDAGVTTAVLDPIEGLSDLTSGEDYLSLMESNLAALEQANGCR